MRAAVRVLVCLLRVVTATLACMPPAVARTTMLPAAQCAPPRTLNCGSSPISPRA